MELNITVAIPIVIALVEAVKKIIPELEPRWHPLVALFFGLIAGFIIFPFSFGVAIFSGVIIGLSASGLYSGARATVKNE